MKTKLIQDKADKYMNQWKYEDRPSAREAFISGYLLALQEQSDNDVERDGLDEQAAEDLVCICVGGYRMPYKNCKHCRGLCGANK